MGVWIETMLKPPPHKPPSVTPFVGVWIETDPAASAEDDDKVTPFVGVWIETYDDMLYLGNIVSHTLRGCVD